MSIHLHTRSICDACHANRATISRRGFWYCASCDSSFTEFSVTPDRFGVNATAAKTSPPAPAAVASFEAEVSALEAGWRREALQSRFVPNFEKMFDEIMSTPIGGGA